MENDKISITYSCDQCDYKAKEKGHLKTHNKTVHKNVGYSCNQCEYKTKEKVHLKTHNETVHDNSNQEDEFQISTQEIIDDAITSRN